MTDSFNDDIRPPDEVIRGQLIEDNKSNDDNYRYKMPPVSIKIGGAGNGIFTIINNIDEIANAINTPSEILYKYISYSLGSAFNEKKKKFYWFTY